MKVREPCALQIPSSLIAIQSAVACAVDGFQEVPSYIREHLVEIAKAVNMANIGNTGNFFWPSVQVNVAVAVLNSSGKCAQNMANHI